MDIRVQPLEPDGYYHIYNRGINGTIIFKNDDNHSYFLKQFSKYVLEVADVFAYCLMPNHFHFLLKVKSEESLASFLSKNITPSSVSKEGLHAPQNITSKQLSRFISSYTQAFNKVTNRHGALLESPFKRIKIDSEEYLKNLILYIHQNPIDLHVDFRKFKYSSYQSILSNAKTNLMRNEVLALFGGYENFIFSHKKVVDFSF